MGRWVAFPSHQIRKAPGLTLRAPSVAPASTRHILPFRLARDGLPSSDGRAFMRWFAKPFLVTSNPALRLVLRLAHLVWSA